MTPTWLMTRTGEFVVKVVVPPFSPAAEIINWGARFFVRQSNGEYREGMVWVASRESEVADDGA